MDYSAPAIKIDLSIRDAQFILKYQLISRALIVKASIKALKDYSGVPAELVILRAEFIEIQRQLDIINNDDVISLK